MKEPSCHIRNLAEKKGEKLCICLNSDNCHHNGLDPKTVGYAVGYSVRYRDQYPTAYYCQI